MNSYFLEFLTLPLRKKTIDTHTASSHKTTSQSHKQTLTLVHDSKGPLSHLFFQLDLFELHKHVVEDERLLHVLDVLVVAALGVAQQAVAQLVQHEFLLFLTALVEEDTCVEIENSN